MNQPSGHMPEIGDDEVNLLIAQLVRLKALHPAPGPVPVGNSILLATDIESGDAPALCERSVA